MEFDRQSQIMTAATGVTTALLAYLGGGDKVGVLNFGLAGASLGAGLALSLSRPGMGPFDSTRDRVEKCFAHVQMRLEGMAEEADSDLQDRNTSLNQVIEYSTFALFAYWVWSVPVGATVLQSLGLTGLATALWIKARQTLITNPISLRPAPLSYLTTGKFPNQSIETEPTEPLVPPPVEKEVGESNSGSASDESPPATPVPLTREEEEAFPLLLQEARRHLATIRSAHSGIKNRRYDCFMNATMQWFLHTPLLNIALATDPEGWKDRPDKDRRFYFRFVRTLLQMGKINGMQADDPIAYWARPELEFSEEDQEDAQEAIQKSGAFFELGDDTNRNLWWQCEIKRRFDIRDDSERLVRLPSQDPQGRQWNASPVDQGGYRIDSRNPDWLMTMEPPAQLGNEGVPLQALINHQFTPLPCDNGGRVSLKGHVYDSRIVTEQTLIKESRPDLYCMFKRFLYKPTRKLAYKVQTNDFKVTIDNKPYEVRSFIVHHGSTMSKGHYTTFAKQGEAWWHYSDWSVQEVQLDEATRLFADAYVVHFAQQSND